MSMVFCTQCGQKIAVTARHCPHCGAPQAAPAAAPIAPDSTAKKAVPEGIKGWSWGAFLLNWVWAIGNKTWIGLLALIPYGGLIMAIILGFKGREWAWQNKEWESVEHFQRVQKQWNFWGFIVAGVMLIVIAIGIGVAMYEESSQYSEGADFDPSPEVLALMRSISEPVPIQLASAPVSAEPQAQVPVPAPTPVPVERPQQSTSLCPGSTLVFACRTTKGKAVQVCDAGATLHYSFGTPGQTPEMALAVPRHRASTEQWDGMNQAIYYSVNIPNGNTVYGVFTAVNRMSDEHEMSAGISVEVNGKHVATLECRPETVVADLEGIDLPLVDWQ